jgi:hypothetical protein
VLTVRGGRRITIRLAATSVALCIVILGSTGMSAPRVIVAQTSDALERVYDGDGAEPSHTR